MSTGALSFRERVESYKFSLMLLALLALILAPLIVGDSSRRSFAFASASLLVLLFGVVSVLRHRRAVVFTLALASFATLLQVAGLVRGPQFGSQLRIAVFAFFLLFLATLIIRDVLEAREITWDKIQGAVCAYLLLGLAWGLLYGWVALLDPQAFSGAGHHPTESPGDPMIYFSFVTLTTLGYGDITPVSHTARTLAWLEAAFGQIYLVVLVARLVSLHLVRSSPGDD